MDLTTSLSHTPVVSTASSAVAPTATKAVIAQPAAPAAGPSPAAGVASMLGSLAFVLAIIFAFAWLLRRLQGMRAPRGGELRLEGGLQIGAKERVVVLQAGDTRLLLGVAAGRISLLHRYDDAAAVHPTVETPSVPAPQMPQVNISPFGEQLRKLFAVK